MAKSPVQPPSRKRCTFSSFTSSSRPLALGPSFESGDSRLPDSEEQAHPIGFLLLVPRKSRHSLGTG